MEWRDMFATGCAIILLNKYLNLHKNVQVERITVTEDVDMEELRRMGILLHYYFHSIELKMFYCLFFQN